MFSILEQQLKEGVDYNALHQQMIYAPLATHSSFLFPGNLRIGDRQNIVPSDCPTDKQQNSAYYPTTSSAQAYHDGDEKSGHPLHRRARRVFVPEQQKDDLYWCKRLKNNDSARRSRAKRKAMESQIEQKLLSVQEENARLRKELAILRRRFGCTDKDDLEVEEAITIKEELIEPENDSHNTHNMVCPMIEIEDDESLDDKLDDTLSSSLSSVSEDNDYRNDNSPNTSSDSFGNDNRNDNSGTDTSDGSLKDEESKFDLSRDEILFHKLPHKFRLKFYKHSSFSGHLK
ncbi:hypothetical protein FSP39_011460 [Pinctada imbricata]|uniref:BZIP domain-containing protein n=1 Tax=Pinctada imbricata TaxID=66713 RepID=A0AA88Y6K9_PINIB|nr:hypothetical protein FSP39_011460 [Pinctada imbricata]